MHLSKGSEEEHEKSHPGNWCCGLDSNEALREYRFPALLLHQPEKEIIRFLRLQIGISLSWKTQSEYGAPKLSYACFFF
jgi:hypothetical protein